MCLKSNLERCNITENLKVKNLNLSKSKDYYERGKFLKESSKKLMMKDFVLKYSLSCSKNSIHMNPLSTEQSVDSQFMLEKFVGFALMHSPMKVFDFICGNFSRYSSFISIVSLFLPLREMYNFLEACFCHAYPAISSSAEVEIFSNRFRASAAMIFQNQRDFTMNSKVKKKSLSLDQEDIKRKFTPLSVEKAKILQEDILSYFQRYKFSRLPNDDFSKAAILLIKYEHRKDRLIASIHMNNNAEILWGYSNQELMNAFLKYNEVESSKGQQIFVVPTIRLFHPEDGFLFGGGSIIHNFFRSPFSCTLRIIDRRGNIIHCYAESKNEFFEDGSVKNFTLGLLPKTHQISE